jgi:hypothetical protein
MMRRLLDEITAASHVEGDTTTLEDFSVIAELGADEEKDWPLACSCSLPHSRSVRPTPRTDLPAHPR